MTGKQSSDELQKCEAAFLASRARDFLYGKQGIRNAFSISPTGDYEEHAIELADTGQYIYLNEF